MPLGPLKNVFNAYLQKLKKFFNSQIDDYQLFITLIRISEEDLFN